MIDADIGTWSAWTDPEQAGWSSPALAAARDASARINTAGVMVVAGGRVVAAWGEVARDYNVHSIRKSLISAQFGMHHAEGRIPLEATLAGLGIDDKEGLSERERLATVLDLLCARSGIYHPTGFETPWMASIKPARGSVGPGTTWCYNNWDFNALGTIFRQFTGAEIHADFAGRIAAPIGMQDFDPARDGRMVDLEPSVHQAYPFRMTARDMARFGQLFLRGGAWGAAQIVPQDWVEVSTAPISEAGVHGAYGYMWWVSRAGILFPNALVPAGTYAAMGAGGHYIAVVPAHDAVVVHRVDTDVPGRMVSGVENGVLLRKILSAAPR